MEESLKPIGPCQKEKKRWFWSGEGKRSYIISNLKMLNPCPFNSGHSTKNKRGNSEKDWKAKDWKTAIVHKKEEKKCIKKRNVHVLLVLVFPEKEERIKKLNRLNSIQPHVFVFLKEKEKKVACGRATLTVV